MKLLTSCLVLSLCVLLAGCESLTPAECVTADWRQLGVKDGSLGKTDRAASYQEACSKTGISVNLNSYRNGRSEGLQSYCRLDNAMNEGLAGRSYSRVCPAPLDQAFVVFHESGYRLQAARGNLTRLQREQDKLESELTDKKTTSDRKSTIRDLLSRSDRRMAEARFEVRSAESYLEKMRDELRRRGPY